MQPRLISLLVSMILFMSGGSLQAKDKQPQWAVNIVFGSDPGRGHYDGVVGRPKDNWNLIDVGDNELNGLKNARGQATPVSLRVSVNDGEWGIQGQSGVYHAYIYHNNRNVDLQANFQGLSQGRYKIYVFAHGDAPDQNANIELRVGPEVYGKKATLNDGTFDYRSAKYREGNQYVSFEFTVSEHEPVRITSFRDGSSYSMFNAIQIVRLTNRRKDKPARKNSRKTQTNP
jgi:hypothetical protein